MYGMTWPYTCALPIESFLGGTTFWKNIIAEEGMNYSWYFASDTECTMSFTWTINKIHQNTYSGVTRKRKYVFIVNFLNVM